ncbi:membrane protein, partial [Methanocorpusculum sp.]|nr:membrane protein [Methanocorpusculum sp.]
DYLSRTIASVVVKKDFGKVKVAFDVTLVCIAAVTSLVFLHEIVGIREGSLIAALTVGIIARTVAAKLSFLLKN